MAVDPQGTTLRKHQQAVDKRYRRKSAARETTCHEHTFCCFASRFDRPQNDPREQQPDCAPDNTQGARHYE